MDWKNYEEVVKSIYETLGKNSGVTIECFGNTCKVRGKSEVEHQIDVLTKYSDGVHSYRTAIECKYWNQKIDKDTIMKLSEIVEDAGLNKGVVVSKLGFTEDAIKTAKTRNIGLVELREPTEQDWEGRIKTIVVNINMLLPEILRMDILVKEDQKLTEVQILSMLLNDYIVKGKDQSTQTLGDIAKQFHTELAKQEGGKEYAKVYSFNEDSILISKIQNIEFPITGVKFTGTLKILRKEVKINGEDTVWMIMKSIFENRSYTISKDRNISEHKS